MRKKALQDAWDKMGKNRKAWDLESVMEREDVKKKYERDKKSVHFGYLRQLIFEKNSELPPEQRIYKGRVVFRGDQVKDESGNYAVFTEQGPGYICNRTGL